jgi:hypothetical protein
MIPHDPCSVKGVPVVFSLSFQIFVQKLGFHPPGHGLEGVLLGAVPDFSVLPGLAHFFAGAK